MRTKGHLQAIDRLEASGALIITGEAGIGKTTLANQLLLEYVADGYQPACIADDVEAAEHLFVPNEKQFFLFDDFLGRNYLEALSGHEGSRIAIFIRRIVKDKSKRFVLTSRTTIINQARVLIDSLAKEKTQRHELELVIAGFSGLERAQILYSHMWHSTIKRSLLSQLYKDRRYRRVIDHRNFNPRLVTYLFDAERLKRITARQYWG